jgi:hypothetical protein
LKPPGAAVICAERSESPVSALTAKIFLVQHWSQTALSRYSRRHRSLQSSFRIAAIRAWRSISNGGAFRMAEHFDRGNDGRAGAKYRGYTV